MSDDCKRFISDVHDAYTTYPSIIDESYNIVVELGDDRTSTVSYKIIKDYYDGYRKSTVSRQVMINRAVLRINEIINGSNK